MECTYLTTSASWQAISCMYFMILTTWRELVYIESNPKLIFFFFKSVNTPTYSTRKIQILRRKHGPLPVPPKCQRIKVPIFTSHKCGGSNHLMTKTHIDGNYCMANTYSLFLSLIRNIELYYALLLTLNNLHVLYVCLLKNTFCKSVQLVLLNFMKFFNVKIPSVNKMSDEKRNIDIV